MAAVLIHLWPSGPNSTQTSYTLLYTDLHNPHLRLVNISYQGWAELRRRGTSWR